MDNLYAQLEPLVRPHFRRLPEEGELLSLTALYQHLGTHVPELTARDAYWLTILQVRAVLQRDYLRPANLTAEAGHALTNLARMTMVRAHPEVFPLDTEGWLEGSRDSEKWAAECNEIRLRAIQQQPPRNDRERDLEGWLWAINDSRLVSRSELHDQISREKRRHSSALGEWLDPSEEANEADLPEILPLSQSACYGTFFIRSDGRAAVHKYKIRDALRRLYGWERPDSATREEPVEAPAECLGSPVGLHPEPDPSEAAACSELTELWTEFREAASVRARAAARTAHERLVARILGAPEALADLKVTKRQEWARELSDSTVERAWHAAQAIGRHFFRDGRADSGS